MKQTIVNPDIDPARRLTMAISLPCADWEKLGAALADMEGTLFQTTADAIIHGLAKVGYFVVKN